MVAAVVLAGLVLAAGLSGGYGVPGAGALAAVSVLWLMVNGPMEGPVLVVVTHSNGLTGGDLAGLAGLGLAVFQGARARRRRTSGRRDDGSATTDPTRPTRPGRAAPRARRR